MRRLLLLVCAIVLVDTMFYAALTPLLPHYADELGLSKAGAGILSGSYAAGTLLGSLPSGFVAARIGVKRTVLLGLSLMAASSIAFGVGHSIWVLDPARLVQGLGGAFSWTGALAWLVAAAPRERRGEVIGVAIGAAVGGALLGPVLGGAAVLVGTEPAFAAVAVLGACLAVWALRTPAPPPTGRQPLRRLLAAGRDGRIATGLWLIALPGILVGSLSVLAPLRLHALGLGAVAIGAVFLVSAALESGVSPLVGRLSDRRGRLAPARVGLAASTCVVLAIPWIDERFALAAAVVCAGMAFGTFWAPGMALVSDGTEATGLDHGFGVALMSLAWAPGQVIGSAVGGAVAQATSDAVPYIGGAVLCVVTLLALRRATIEAPWRFASSS